MPDSFILLKYWRHCCLTIFPTHSFKLHSYWIISFSAIGQKSSGHRLWILMNAHNFDSSVSTALFHYGGHYTNENVVFVCLFLLRNAYGPWITQTQQDFCNVISSKSSDSSPSTSIRANTKFDKIILYGLGSWCLRVLAFGHMSQTARITW